MREPKHAVDVVFDDQHWYATRHRDDQIRDALALCGCEPGKRLVQQQDPRLGAERDPEIEQPLPAIGKLAALDVLNAVEAEEANKLRGFHVDLGISVYVPPQIEARRMLRLH